MKEIPCPSRFIKQRLRDPEQDRRMECARTADHKGWHRNESGDLKWEDGAEVDVSELL